ncbi:MAG TPA: type II secretion system protein [Candidatus Methylacidiphilales bacterium]
MLTPCLVFRRTARTSNRGGFTLVELLVVIGIIAILAGVALGPITNGIKKAKQSAGMQQVRQIGLAEFSFSNDNNGQYPDTAVPTGNTGTGAAAVVQPLISGSYASDPAIFYIGGGQEHKFAGTNPGSTIAPVNISFDFTGNAGNGVNSNFPDQCPVAWSTIKNGTEPTLTTAAGTALTAIPDAGSPFGTAGVAVMFKSNSAAFVVANSIGGATPTCTIVDTSWSGGVPSSATATTLQGGG